MAADKDAAGVAAALRSLRPAVAVFTSVPIAGSYARAAAPGAADSGCRVQGSGLQGPGFRGAGPRV